MFRRTTSDVSFQGVSKLFATACETDDIEMRNLTNQEEDIIYLDQKLRIIMS